MVAAGGTTTSGFRLAAHAMAASTKQTCARILCVLVVLCTLTAGQLEQYDLTLTVREDVSIGTVVGVVEGDKYSPPYSRLIKNPATDNMTLSSFDVDLSNGRITTKDTLDREEREKHTIIISTFSQPTQLVIVEVRLLDINDITPTFINPSLLASIPESAPRTHKIALGSVRDEDLGDNSTQTVEIVSGNDGNTFFLQIKNSSNVDKILDLVVNTDHLDFEGKKVYNLVIRATDGGGRSSDMQVTIRILDTNDNEPIFNNSKYSARVAENVTVGTSIIQVEATDSDSEENSRITYSIDPKTDPEEYFSIDPRTGWVKVRKPLDFETKPQFVLTLEATDSGSPPLSGSTGLDIIVVNINEQPANISMTFKPDFRNGHVSEDTPVDTVVAVVTIDDPDTDVVRNVEVSLYGGEGYFQLIKTNRLEGNELDLVVLDSLDRETVPAYEMTIVVTDVGTPPLSANREFRITVEDVNDNDPVFLRSKYSADVEETAEIGKSVLKVSATDDDFGDNARITYRIQDGSSHMGWFTVDSSTGVVTTRASVDCELSPQLLVIVATDGGNPPRMATAQVSISIRDVNDKEPEFETSFYSIKIAEDRRVGDCVLTVSAIDPECGASAPVTYRMARMLAPLREFRVDALTGDICVQAALDYELTTSYQFQVEAVDAGNLTSQAVVQVEVKDVNDNHPRFEPNRYPINVVSGVAPGPLITVQARDLDSGHFGTATYSIIYGNDQGFFSVNADTGAVSLDQQLPPGERVFRLHVLATDGGGLTSPDPAQVTVSVISGAVHTPVFSPTMFNFSVAEDALPGRVVGQVQATLDDTGGNSEISYSITFQTESWFQVNSSTGKITTSGQLDRERHAFVVLNVQAQAHFPHVYAVAQVNVSIQDVNDNAPSFPPTAMLELEVREDEAPGTPLYVARARDLDTQNNGVIV
ncbi:protein dachsous, partial [Aplysia californica]|uniref:Protein dachsous n=1 Tax=Aplysia californica TaxID=6500 RepID=A0ABM0KB85_APLCA